MAKPDTVFPGLHWIPVARFFRAAERVAETDLTVLWRKGIRLVLSLLILTILAGLAGGVVKTFLDLRLLFHAAVEVALRQVIIDTLVLLALVEVFKTTFAYFSEGRVKVTFIVDTVLVMMLTEVLSQWFKDGPWARLAVLGAILLTLGAMRVVAVRYSPTQGDASTRSHESLF
ncbi:MAG: phosphate-starvation-inducible PsiE family protein [Nitrospirota bacterium]